MSKDPPPVPKTESYERLPRPLRLIVAVLIPVVLLSVAGYYTRSLIHSKPEPRTRPAVVPETRVEATRLKPETFQILLDTRGVVQPQTETTLIPEVSGRIVKVSPKFRDGGFFSKGETLVEIDSLNYETALTISKSSLAQAKVALAEEKARGDQALQNWKRLNKTGEPSDLVLRKPQLAEAEARVLAATAEVEKAERDIERTKISAPYNGRIVEQMVDIGQFVNSGTQLATTYAIDTVEVRLPLTNQQLTFVDLPEEFVDGGVDVEGPEVLLISNVGAKQAQWTARITRVEGTLDARSRQLFVVAEIDEPFKKRADGTPPPKMGLFADAIVKGREVSDVFVLPRKSLRADGEVIVVTEDQTIQRTKVEPLWTDRDNVVIPVEGAGLKAGQVVCLTPLAFPTNGSKVIPTIDGVAPTTELTGPGKGGKGGGAWKGKGKGGT